MEVDTLRAASHLFPVDTGLGWDKMHPRSLGTRLPDEALVILVRLLAMCEFLGTWPTHIGIVLICLIPKPDGGRRPIGLLPSIIRWWMRARLQVVRSWQAANDRSYFYAGVLKGATVASWKQAARAELAASMPNTDHAAALLDMVKAYERVPHAWLVRQGIKYSYPMRILRLSICAYRLQRTVVIDKVCSVLIAATRGITAGAGHATVELRLLLIEFLDDVVYSCRRITLTVFVDDTSLEVSGPKARVKKELVKATSMFTKALVAVGMEFSPTKNAVMATDNQLAHCQTVATLAH